MAFPQEIVQQIGSYMPWLLHPWDDGSRTLVRTPFYNPVLCLRNHCAVDRFISYIVPDPRCNLTVTKLYTMFIA